MSDYLDQVSRKYLEYKNFADSFGLRFVPGVLPGYDDNALRGPGRPILPRDEQAFYRKNWLTGWDFLNPDVPMVLVTSLNEWHEGTELESSSEYGTGYQVKTKEMSDDFVNARAKPVDIRAIISAAHDELGIDSTAGDDWW